MSLEPVISGKQLDDQPEEGPVTQRGVVQHTAQDSGRLLPSAGMIGDGHYRLLWEATTDVVLLLSEQNVILYANPAVTEIFGYARDEVVGREISMLQPERMREPHRRGLQAYLQSGIKKINWRNTEAFGLHKDGHEFPVEISFSDMRVDGQHMFAGFIRDISVRVQSEQALKVSEERLNLVIGASQLGTWDWDIKSNELSWSPQCKLLYGLPPGLRVTHQAFRDALHPVDRDKIDSQARQALRDKSLYQAEFRTVWPDGSVHWLASMGRGLYDAQGNPECMLGVTFDVSERHRAEQSLLEWKNRYEATVNASGHLLYDWDPASNVMSYAGDVQRLLGYSVEELGNHLHQWLELVVHPEDRGKFNREIERVLQSNEAFHLEYRVLRKDGTPLIVQDDGHFVLDAAEHITRMVGFVSDITVARKNEAALRDSEERFRRIVETAEEGIWTIDAQANTSFVNRKMASMLGYTIEEMWMRPLVDFMDDEGRAIAQANIKRREQGIAEQHDFKFRRKDGTDLWASLSASPTYDGTGNYTGSLAMVTDITQRKLSEELIWQQANFDALTHLPNRRMFHDRLEQELRKDKRDGSQLALLFIDLDRFKEVNDSLGHNVGDQLLIEAAHRIGASVRESDTVARLGGDEFTVILPAITDAGSAERVAQQIIKRLAAPFQLAKHKAFVTASIGITIYPDDATRVEDLLRYADQAMYVAKKSGRNRYCYFTSALQQAAVSRMQLSNDLRSALEGQQFRVYYQPIVELATGSVRKAEALIRWQHPVRGLVSPAEFIPMAEHTGLINDIGDWVFRQAAQQVKYWRTEFDPEFQVSVNKSPAQFRTDGGDGGSRWLGYLRELGLPGESITVEITESLLLDTTERVKQVLLEFRDAGVQAALDDFGTGYSSLVYLRELDIDYLKIDCSFVRNLDSNQSDRVLCEAIILMAHKLGLKVIAEGVETLAQRDILLEAGCDYAQGYFFSRPAPPDLLFK
ncbi:MAG: PAS domain S-box protein [Pseudomonadota bacterium]